MRWSFFTLLAAAAVAYALWIYFRVDLAVPSARRLATLRACALLTILLLLFDVRVPLAGGGGSPDWVLLDASLSMAAVGADGSSAWEGASARARTLASEGWNVVPFGGVGAREGWDGDALPSAVGSRLASALERAAESGARRIVVLSDLRFEDAVAVRGVLDALPLDVRFEGFGGAVPNAGVSHLEVPDFARPGEAVTAEVEVHGAGVGDSLTVEIRAEEAVVATLRVETPAPGLRGRASVDVPYPEAGDRVRYTATVAGNGDAFPSDDRAVDYAAVGREEGALVLVSLSPDWEPRYLLPVLEEVTGLPTAAFLRAGPDRFVQAGRAIDRGAPADSAAVRRAVDAAALLVVHGLGDASDPFGRRLSERPGRKVLMIRDASAATLVGLSSGAARPGEWYVSADVPTSPIAGSLAGVPLQGLPPLTDLLPIEGSNLVAPLLVQLRGAGSPRPALLLTEASGGRTAFVLASGFWRWAARPNGREPYRRLWSGVAGWLMADRSAATAEARPTRLVVGREEPVTWTLPDRTPEARIVVRAEGAEVVDTVVASAGVRSTGVLPPGTYDYTVESAEGDTLGVGRFDVAEATEEMLPVAEEPAAGGPGSTAELGEGAGQPLRTLPWPYLLVMTLLCLEWIGRRRAGLR